MWGRTSTSNTSWRGQERRDALLSPDPQAWELGTAPKPGPGPLCLRARLCAGMVWSAWHPSGCPGLMHHLSTEAPATGAKHPCSTSVSLTPPDIPPTLRPWVATSPLPPLALCPCKLGGHWPSAALDGCRHLWRVRAGNEALLPSAGREMGAQSHPAHLGEVKASKLAKPALNWLAWFCSAAGETPTAGKRERGQVALGVKEVKRRGSGWPGCCRAPSQPAGSGDGAPRCERGDSGEQHQCRGAVPATGFS